MFLLVFSFLALFVKMRTNGDAELYNIHVTYRRKRGIYVRLIGYYYICPLVFFIIRVIIIFFILFIFTLNIILLITFHDRECDLQPLFPSFLFHFVLSLPFHDWDFVSRCITKFSFFSLFPSLSPFFIFSLSHTLFISSRFTKISKVIAQSQSIIK